MKSLLRPSAVIAALLAGVLVLPPVHAREQRVDTALVIAIDSSNSIEAATLNLQFRATLAALESPSVLHAIQGGYYGCIAVSIMMWSTRHRQDIVADWTKICDGEGMSAFVGRVRRPYYNVLHHHGSTTSLAGAVEFGLTMLAEVPFKAERQVIDISGNGIESSLSSGLPQLRRYRAAAEALGVVINGLPIITPRSEPDLVRFYRRNVITRNGFLLVAERIEDFPRAMERKLRMEIAWAND